MTDTPVTIKTYEFLPQAHAARIYLEAEGISAHLADEETGSMVWSLGNAIGYIKLQVASTDAERALIMLQRLQSKTPKDSVSAGGDEPLCLQCGALMAEHQTVCPSCGWSFASESSDLDDEPIVGEEKNASERSHAGRSSSLERLRALKRPVLWFFLWPVIVGLFLLVGALLMGLFNFFVR
jgi:hypothetical protein